MPDFDDSYIDIRVAGGIELRKLLRDLKQQARGDLARKLRRNIRRAADPVVTDLRGAVMRVDVTADPPGRRPGRAYRNRPHLRAKVAAAIGVTITQKGVRIRVNANKVGPYGSALSKYLDAEIAQYRRWRHPVFGRVTRGGDEVWAVQHGQPWFFNTIEGHVDDFRRAVLDAIDEVRDELARG